MTNATVQHPQWAARGFALSTIVAAFTAACSGARTGATCGSGTERQGNVCVASMPHAGNASTNADASIADAGDSRQHDSGTLVTSDRDHDSGSAVAGDSGTHGGSGSGGAGGHDTIMHEPQLDVDGGPACTLGAGLAADITIPITGQLREIVIDPCDAHVYLTNSSQNQIEDYSLESGRLEAPIAVGSMPIGFDITPDGQHLYVANSGGSNISIVDLAAHLESKKLSVMPNFSSDTPLSLAIAGNDKAFFSTTFAGSGFGGRMMSLDLASGEATLVDDFFIRGTTTEATFLKASFDHSTVAAVAGDISSAPVFVYRTSTDMFSPEHDLNGFVSHVAVSSDGKRLLVDGSMVLDETLNLSGTITGGGPYAAFARSGVLAYRATSSEVEIVDTDRFLVTGSITLKTDTMQGGSGGSAVGNMAVSSDGTWLAIITDHGLTLRNLP